MQTDETGRLAVALALEGGGPLGAFTWGVLDRLLDMPELALTVVSGTSAGAMNAAMLVQGLVERGPAGARDLLATFWHRVAIAAGSLPNPAQPWLQTLSVGLNPMLDAMRKAGSALSGNVTFASNPLRGILTEMLRPARFRDAGAAEIVVAATRIRTGEARLFRNDEISVESLLASACLPMLFPAVRIDGEPYWDGGYSSNPPVRAIIEEGAPRDVIIVRTLPSERASLPNGASAVKDRLNEITFGTPLRSELHGLALAKASLGTMADLPEPLARLRDVRLHMIAPSLDEQDGLSSALSPSWSFLTRQQERGRAAASLWLEENADALGRRSSLNLTPYADGAITPSTQPVGTFWKRAAHAS